MDSPLPKTIRLLTSTICGGKTVQSGETVDASVYDASYLVATGSAVYAEKPEKAVNKAKKEKKLPNRMIADVQVNNRDTGE